MADKINRSLMKNLEMTMMEGDRRYRREPVPSKPKEELGLNTGNLSMQQSTFAVIKSTKPTFVPVEDKDHMYYLPADELIVETLEGVKCSECNTIHIVDTTSDNVSFITIIGNLSVNNGGGIIGNGDWKEYGVPVSHFCKSCLIEKIGNIT